MTKHEIAMCGVFALCLPLGQTAFKAAAIYAVKNNSVGFIGAMTNPLLIIAFSCYAITALLWYNILTTVPLSQAYIFSIVGSATVPVIAWAIFSEVLSGRFIFGFAIILIGFYIAVSGGK